MKRIVQQGLCIVLMIGSSCYGQSVADAARENRKQKTEKGTTSARTISNDDLFATPEVIQLLPGSSSTGQGTLVAPGRGKHDYRVVRLDASRFVNGGTIHITITVGDGTSEGSFDLYPENLPLPEEGFPTPLANAWNVTRASGAKIHYHFSHGMVFQLAAEGSWNSKAGATNTYNLVVDVDSPSAK